MLSGGSLENLPQIVAILIVVQAKIDGKALG
jgi:hypothetical protein